MSAQRIPSLTLLEPIANYVAMRFADRGVSMSSVHQMLEVFQYHCVKTEVAQDAPRLGVDPAKLVAWIGKAREKDDRIKRCSDAADVLGKVAQWYVDQFEAAKGDVVVTRKLYDSLSGFLTLLAWKFKTFEKRTGQFQSHGEAMSPITSKIRGLGSAKDKLNLLEFCQSVRDDLQQAVADKPWRARLAVGLSVRPERRGPPLDRKKKGKRRY